MPVDSSENDIWTASLLATLSAFLESSAMPTPQLSDDERTWLLRWPPSTHDTKE